MRRAVAVLALLAVMVLATESAGRIATVRAVDARAGVPGGLCSLWTAKQVSEAMKERMRVVRNDPDICGWYGRADRSGRIATASVSLFGGDPTSDLALLDQARESGPQWAGETEVAGIPVLRTRMERFGKSRDSRMDAFPDPATWMMFGAHSNKGANTDAALTRLIEIAASQLGVTSPPSASPAASPATSPIASPGGATSSGAPGSPAPSAPAGSPAAGGEISELFPTEVAGSPIVTQQLTLGGGGGFLSAEQVRAEQRLTRLLRPLGLTLDDVPLLVGQPESMTWGLLAIQVKGADIGPFVGPILTLLDMRRSDGPPAPDVVAGRDASVVTNATGRGFAYPKDDVLWLVFAEDDAALTIFESLP